MTGRAREPALLDLVGEMYRTAGEPAHWPEVLAKFSRVIECAGVTLYAVDRRDWSIPFMVNHELPEIMQREYEEHYLAIDPRPRCALAHPNQPIYDYLHDSETTIEHSEYYDWHRRRAGFRYYIGGLLTGADDPTSFIGIGLQRTPRQGHVDEHEIVLFDRLLPHLRQAVQLSTRFAELRARHAVLADALHGSETAMVLLDRRGAVAFATAAAEPLLGGGEGLIVDRDGRLRARRPSDDAGLQRLIVAVAHDDLSPGGELALPRASGLPPLVVSVRRLHLPEDLMIAHRPVVTAVTIRDPSATTQPETRSLQATFGLTPAEAALAAALAAGSDLKTYAHQAGVTHETARWHLKNVFAKTGTNKQADLVRLLVRTMPPGEP